jgi:hypothetical protein
MWSLSGFGRDKLNAAGKLSQRARIIFTPTSEEAFTLGFIAGHPPGVRIRFLLPSASPYKTNKKIR